MTLWQLARVANEIRSTRDEYMIVGLDPGVLFKCTPATLIENLWMGWFYARQHGTFRAISFLPTRKWKAVYVYVIYTSRGARFARPLLHPFCIFHHVATPTACSLM